jgi:hypothetical protein
MKAVELQLPVNQDGTITLPPEVMAQIGYEDTVRLIVIVPEQMSEEEEEAAWKRLGAKYFLKGYAPEDAVYDDL